MQEFNVQILTKLGGIRKKKIAARDEKGAIEIAKSKFPLYKEIQIVSAENADESFDQSDDAFESTLEEAKRKSLMAACRNKMTEGLLWIGSGIFIAIITFVFSGGLFVLVILPVGWGANIYIKASKKLRALEAEERQSRRRASN